MIKELTAAEWKHMALALGWVEVDRDPQGGDEPCLIHEELDRVWPAGDFEGAVRDLGLDDADFEEFAASLSA
jgi:hypothetical protein